MGLFDGRDPWGKEGSAAQVARLLKAPVVLVVDARGMAGSIAPLALGLRPPPSGVRVVGVVANRVVRSGTPRSSERPWPPLACPSWAGFPKTPPWSFPSATWAWCWRGRWSHP
jgi:cobyrinic acid a,c-diamide synthase